MPGPRPPDRLQFLPGKITLVGGAQRHRGSDANTVSALTVIFHGERMPGAWRTARPARAGAVTRNAEAPAVILAGAPDLRFHLG